MAKAWGTTLRQGAAGGVPEVGGKLQFPAAPWTVGDGEWSRAWLRKWRSFRRGLLEGDGRSVEDFAGEHREVLELGCLQMALGVLVRRQEAWGGGVSARRGCRAR